MKTTIFIAPLYYIRLPIKSENFHIIDKNISLTNNKRQIENLLRRFTNLIHLIGKLEYENLISGKPILYSIKELPDLKSVEKEMHHFLTRVEYFSHVVWSLKDSLVNSETCFAIQDEDNEINIHTNNFGSYYSDIGLTNAEILLNNKEIEFIKDRYLFDENYDYESIKKKGSILEKGTSRYQRATHHFVNARRSNTYEFKISHYCAGYESLLSSSTTELTHQLSERIALLCSKAKEERYEVYKLAKRIYSIRSRVVHGATVDQKDIILLAKYADDWARYLINLIFQDNEFYNIIFEKNEQNVDEYFLKKLFL
ncbi:hypothetical protein CH372_18475 [Leptospira meyeri]|uniref:HEPN domain-containing protein n=1 Tax=Leptospira meyeri TaxID=29508 RepID=UPI000C2ABDDA|nr:HEPN domain-containing protein [Leptospira meyeri]PKA10610.1 hypothetical protein CH372_18475 [Leptospira meyeri]PKA23691.1 hypothetical protein CH381_24270 [Leptospira sp. mixed culture ATI2-C-A1]